MLHSYAGESMTKRARGMNRGSMMLSPYLTLVAAFAFGIAGVAAPNHGLALAFLGACILLAALSLAMSLRFTTHPSLEKFERRRRR